MIKVFCPLLIVAKICGLCPWEWWVVGVIVVASLAVGFAVWTINDKTWQAAISKAIETAGDEFKDDRQEILCQTIMIALLSMLVRKR